MFCIKYIYLEFVIFWQLVCEKINIYNFCWIVLFVVTQGDGLLNLLEIEPHCYLSPSLSIPALLKFHKLQK